MSVLKIVELRARPGQEAELDAVLIQARDGFHDEPGTQLWDIFNGTGADDRTLVEVFADDEAVREHDDSETTTELLAGLRPLLAAEPRVVVRRSSSGHNHDHDEK